MDEFIDTCIIISGLDNKDKYYEVIQIFLSGSKNIIISIYQEKEEIPKLFLRKEKIFLEAIKFCKNPQYSVDYSSLTDKEKIFLKTLITKISQKQENEQAIKDMLKEVIILKRNVNYFIQKKVIRKVTPVIDENLTKIIKQYNQNKADAKIISSAIQEHQKNNLIAFTLDKNDWKILPVKDKIEGMGFSCPEIRFLR